MSAKLVVRRNTLKNMIMRVLTFTSNIADADKSLRELKVKLFELDRNYNTVFEVHMQVMELTGADSADFEETEFESIQSAYEIAKARLLDAIDLIDVVIAPAIVPAAAPTRSEIKLPVLTITPFNGNYNAWKSFRDLFLSAVGDRRDLTGAQKLHYLKSFLDGEAAQLVRPYAVSDGNYRIAWTALDCRYNNERLLVNSHFHRLFEQPVVKCESAGLLRQLLDTTAECISALKSHNLPTDNWDAVIVYIITQRLDAETHKQWEISLDDNEFPAFSELEKFLEKRCRSLEAIAGAQSTSSRAAETSQRSSVPRQSNTRASVNHTSGNPFHLCPACNNNHHIKNCSQFQGMLVAERRELVKDRRLCYICLKGGHVSAECVQAMCGKCSGRHHELLHMNSVATDVATTSVSDAAQSNFVCGTRSVQVLLSTAWITIGESPERVRVLVDQGSTTSLIRESCVQRLKLNRRRISVPLRGIGGAEAGTATSMVNITIKSCVDNTLQFKVTALVMRKLTGFLPTHRVTLANRPVLSGVHLADPQYFEPGEVDMVLGADIYGLLLRDGIIAGCTESGRERPTAQNTALGWLLSGPISTSCDRSNVVSPISLHLDVEWDMRKFWEVEEVGEASQLSEDEMACEAHFVATHERTDGGRYVVRLPFSTNPDTVLGDSRGAALRRLRSIRRRLDQQPDLAVQYEEFLREYANLGHMQKAYKPATGTTYYLPHHFVLKESSTTTRLRVVFDASCKTTSGQSLNDIQLIGPRLQDDLIVLVMRFRRHAVALTADIAKMYRQINVHKSDWDLQRILWHDMNGDVEEWQLTTVTYGMAASPYLAVRALHQLAKDEQAVYPRAAQVVLSDFYVDDLITGRDSPEEAVELQRELCELMSCGGMELRKWSSNCPITLSNIPMELRESAKPLHLSVDASIKTLGLMWHPACDCFSFVVETSSCETRVTKRSILSAVAKLFDPLGLLAPTIILAKIMIQRLWTSGLNWDDVVPEPIRSSWLDYHQNLKHLEKLQFHRWIGARKRMNLQFHGFADASETAYGAVIYARCEMPDGQFRISLMMAKTKVAPLKQLTLPRLELCAAALLAKLLKNVMVTFGNDAENYTLWSDSQVALCWIRKEPRTWKTFVANRVAAIQTHTTPDRWQHVRSADNPADCLSRGLLPAELTTHELWMNGPVWLKEPESSWPSNETREETLIDARAPDILSVTLHVDDGGDGLELLSRYSSLTRLRYITAWIQRFIRNCRTPAEQRQRNIMTVPELRQAMLLWVKRVQHAEYPQEMSCCKRGVNLKTSSKLITLNAFLDEQGVLRVGGRLRNAAIPPETAYPAILPGNSHLTTLIIDEAHILLLHGGAQLMLNYIRQRYWVIGGKQRVRQHVLKCMQCIRQRPRCGVQQMGDLPEYRVTPSRAFIRSGVDYAGPMAYKSRSGRGMRIEKGYVALFVCLATKAVHLEFVSDLTSATFVAAFRRFVSRRGAVKEMLSDNATNFIGARNEMSSVVNSPLHNEEVARVLATDGTVWRTIPPRSPHFGGLWEAGVKAVKHHLKRFVGGQLLTFEEFSTVLAQIEAILNSRPLCALTDDPEDLDVLTPGHFLIGGPPIVIPEYDLTDVPCNRLTRWQLVNQITQHLWRRWQREYLTTLQQRYKWSHTTENAHVGQLVLLKDDLLPPGKWKMARIIATRPGEDGRVRVVVLKHATGETTRAITRVCLLPINADADAENN